MNQDFEVLSITMHKEGTAIQLQNQASGKVLGTLTLNLTDEEAKKMGKKPGDNISVKVG